MKIPALSFVENNVGVTPIRTSVRNRIGILAPFNRGPENSPSFVTGDTDFVNRYGSDTSIGSLAYQSARNQGAEDFCLVRILGNPKVAKGQITIGGIATKPNVLYVTLGFIGKVQEITNIQETITTSGQYTSTVSGRYFFKVTSIGDGVATIKYTFVALGASEIINWAGIFNSISVSLISDQGVIKELVNGVSLTFGVSGQSNDLSLNLNDEWKIRVSSFVQEVDINSGDIPSQIANSIVESLIGVDPFGQVTKTSSDDGVIFELAPTNELLGSIGNKFSYKFTLLDPDYSGITISPELGSLTQMQGGEDGPRRAYRDFYSLAGVPLLRLVAVNAGSWANQIKVTLYPIDSKQIRLTIYDLNANNFNPAIQSETYILNLSDTDAFGGLNQLANSNYVNGLFLPKFLNPIGFDASYLTQSPLRLAPAVSSITDAEDIRHPNYFGPSALLDVSLEEGYDGPTISDEDYIQALKKLESQPVHIVLAPGVYDSPKIQQALISHAENSTDKDGLRIAILNARPNLVPNAARKQTFGLESKRAVMVVGWKTYANQPNAGRFTLSPDSSYAGKLAAIPFYASPHSRRTAGTVFNITEVDTANYSNSASLQLYTDAKLEVLHIDPSSQGFLYTTGRTLSSDAAWDKVYIRRTYDVIRQDLYDLLGQYIGEPHTNLVRRQIASAINAYMGELLRNGQIANYKNVTVDSSNNPPESYTNGELNVTLEFLPLYAVDYINISLIRNTGDGLVTFGN